MSAFTLYLIDIMFLSDFEMRYPRGQKTLLYHRAKQENYAPYLNQDGLVRRLMRFADSASQYKKNEVLYSQFQLTLNADSVA